MQEKGGYDGVALKYDRSDGSMIIIASWIAMLVAAFFAVVAGIYDVHSPYSIGAEPPSPHRVAVRWVLIAISVLAFQIWLFLWCTGTVVRAIFFLDGPESKEAVVQVVTTDD